MPNFVGTILVLVLVLFILMITERHGNQVNQLRLVVLANVLLLK